MSNVLSEDINPPYYMGSKDGHNIQLMDVYEAFSLTPMEANVVKYVVRHRHKGKALLDLEKAHRCLARLISNEKNRLQLLESIEVESANTNLPPDDE